MFVCLALSSVDVTSALQTTLFVKHFPSVGQISRCRPSRHLRVIGEVLFNSTHQLHFGLLQGPQLLIVVVCPSGVLPVNSVLTSMSRRLFDRLYAITDRSVNL